LHRCDEFQRLHVLAACLLIAQLQSCSSATSSLSSFRRRVEALLADPDIRLPDIALEVATHVHASLGTANISNASTSATVSTVSATLAIVEPELFRLTSHGDPAGRALSEALLGALRARLLVGGAVVRVDPPCPIAERRLVPR
jgi:hypothetical protein